MLHFLARSNEIDGRMSQNFFLKKGTTLVIPSFFAGIYHEEDAECVKIFYCGMAEKGKEYTQNLKQHSGSLNN